MGKGKIGRWTAGIFFIILGVVWLISNWMDISIWSVLPYVWPLILIFLGAEFLYKQRTKEDEESVSFDGGAITLLFIVMLVSGGLFSFQNSGFANGISFLGNSWKTSIEISEVYEASELESVLFNFTNGDLVVYGDEVDSITIEGVIKSNHSNEKELQREFEKLKMVKESKEQFEYILKHSTGNFFSLNNNINASLTITVPHSVVLEIITVNGRINTKDINNNVRMTTTNGLVNGSNIVGNVVATSTNGAIYVSLIEGDVEARSTNGKIEVSNVTGSVTTRGTNGAIDITSDRVGGDWEARTTNGRIRIELPKDADVSVEGETSNGTVDGSNITWTRKYDGTRKNKQGSATLGNGTYRINAITTNGAIRINSN